MVYTILMVRVAINGFGRIGRLFFRQAWGRSDIEIVAVNDLASAQNLAYLLKYDSVYRQFDEDVSAEDDAIVVGGKRISVLRVANPAELPWKNLGIDIALEATGVFAEFGKAKAHLDAGAKRVVMTMPAKDPDGTADGATVLVGVNEERLSAVRISSNASCTTNAASPVIEILSKEPGIEKAILSTIHGYTASQSLVDGPTRSSDMRRGRAAAGNIVPSSTGAARAVARALPVLEGKFDGIAVRVPVIAGSYADITFIAKRKTTVEEINEILARAAKEPKWKGVMKVSNEPLVSSDIIGEPYGAIVDLSFTRVVDGTLVKALSWYDNEWGYVSTLVRHVAAAARLA
jgi:glyceraldehyde 3-phosphate dehydrogenase